MKTENFLRVSFFSLGLLLYGCGDVDQGIAEGYDDLPSVGLSEEEETEIYRAHFEGRGIDWESSEPVIAPWTKVIDHELIGHVQEIHPDRILFRRDHTFFESLGVAEILASNLEEAPFLRRIVHLEYTPEVVIAYTEQAEITDAMVSGSFSLNNPGPTIDHENDIATTQLASETGTMETETPQFNPIRTEKGEISFGLEVTYPNGEPPGYRAIFEIEVTVGSDGFSALGWESPKRQFCSDYIESEDSADSLDFLEWLLYWGGESLRSTSFTQWCSYRCCVGLSSCGNDHQYMRATFYEAATGFKSWVNENGYGHRYDTSGDYPRRATVPNNNRTRVLNRLKADRNRASNRTRYDHLISELETIPGDLHWVDMAPEFAKRDCTGTTVTMRVGAGPAIDFEIQPVFRVNYSQNISILDDAVWESRIARRNLVFAIGWLPVYMRIDLNWKTTASASIDSGFDLEVSLPAKRTTIDFYHGVVFPPHNQNTSCTSDSQCPPGGICRNRQCAQFFETLKELTTHTGGRFGPVRENTLNLIGDASTEDRRRLNVVVEAEVSGEAEMTTGPNVMVYLYESAGLGVALEATAEASFNVKGSNKAPAQCESRGEVGVRLQGLGSIQIPLCPLDECKRSGELTLFHSCESAWAANFAWMCPRFDIDSCPSPQNTGTTAQSAGGMNNSSSMTSVSFPPGSNDVQDHYELDALFIQRGNRRILPVEVRGLKAGQCTPERGTVERGCPELLWEATFTECDPEGWADHVALIPDLDQFYVRFRENLQDGDILHIVRQAVPANELNAEGESCAASGSANFSIGVLTESGDVLTGSPVATSVYNSNSYRIDTSNFQQDTSDSSSQGWEFTNQDEGFGEWTPPTSD